MKDNPDSDTSDLDISDILQQDSDTSGLDISDIFQQDSDTFDLDISDILQQDDLYTDQDTLEEILQSYQEAIKLHPEDADSYYGLGNVYRHQGNLTTAAQA